MTTCDIKDLVPEFHDVWSQIPKEFCQAHGKKRIKWLQVCHCLNMGAEILVPLYQPLEAKAVVDMGDFPTIMQTPVAIYRRDSDYSSLKIWRYSYVGDEIR